MREQCTDLQLGEQRSSNIQHDRTDSVKQSRADTGRGAGGAEETDVRGKVGFV